MNTFNELSSIVREEVCGHTYDERRAYDEHCDHVVARTPYVHQQTECKENIVPSYSHRDH